MSVPDVLSINKLGYLMYFSLRNKFCELHSMLVGGYVDIFGITETKLNESFPHSQFTVDGFSMYRVDRDENDGGIACYVNSKNQMIAFTMKMV